MPGIWNIPGYEATFVRLLDRLRQRKEWKFFARLPKRMACSHSPGGPCSCCAASAAAFAIAMGLVVGACSAARASPARWQSGRSSSSCCRCWRRFTDP